MRETTTNIDLLNLSKKLHEVFETPHLEKRFQEVFSFVRIITDRGFDIQDLTSENIQLWNPNVLPTLDNTLLSEKAVCGQS